MADLKPKLVHVADVYPAEVICVGQINCSVLLL